jgi:hypothetical protein
MAAKKIVTGFLLLFVAATVATLAVKEVRRSRALRAEEAARLQTSPSKAMSDPGPLPSASPSTEGTPSLPAPGGPGSRADHAVPPPTPTQDRKIVVTYFITNSRCYSCYKIETLTESAMVNTFAGPLKEGRVEWRVVNTDEPKNAHYLKDYRLFAKSVIVSDMQGGREIRWKNCEKVWDLLDDPKAFETYIIREVKSYLGDA